MNVHPLRRPGLRGRVQLTFALLALGLSVLLASTTYAVARDYLWRQRRDGAVRQAFFDARTVEQALASGPGDLRDLLQRIDVRSRQQSSPALHWHGTWYGTGGADTGPLVPPALVAAARRQGPVMQRTRTGHGLALAVAVPVDRGLYVETFDLKDLNNTLRTLSVILLTAAVLTTAVGAGIGRGASRRAIRPLRTVNAAAVALVGGDLDVRIHAGDDPDLAAVAEAFNTNAAQLQARIERDVRFAGNVGHELRSPLTAMLNAVEILRAKASALDGDGREALSWLHRDVHRLAAMVEDLLAISRFDERAAVLEAEPVALGGFLRSVASRAAGRPVEPKGDDPVLPIDKRRMARAVENLVLNAESHGHGLCALTVAADPHNARILVDDAGPGVPPEHRHTVFERFSRVPPTGRSTARRGVGIGLALTAEQVSLHGGRVWVEDSPYGGARFVVELPRTPS